MAIYMVRQPSGTPNINNVDDFVPFRYAYGDQNGYVEGKGSEFSYTINGNIFRINSGRAVIQGVEVDIDANGYEIIVDNISSKRYHTVYLEVNLALMSVSIKELTDGAGFPFIEESDDLTANSSGIARLILYGFESYEGVISGVKKGIKELSYTKNIKIYNCYEADNAKNINNIEIIKDNDKILIDGYVFPRKKKVWEGKVAIPNESDTFSEVKVEEEFSIGDIIEIEITGDYLERTGKFTIRSSAVVSSYVDNLCFSVSSLQFIKYYPADSGMYAVFPTGYLSNNKTFNLGRLRRIAAETTSISSGLYLSKIYKITE